MKTVTIDTQEAPVKWWAAQDARIRNLSNKSKYSQDIQIQIEKMKIVLGMVYSARGIHESYGKTGVSIKIDRPTVIDKKNLKALESDWSVKGFTKKVSAQGIVYRLKVDQ